jgi:hypothetical protein
MVATDWVLDALDSPAPWVVFAVAGVVVDRSGGVPMGMLRGAAASGGSRGRGVAVSRTPVALLKRLGRALLWLLVLVLLLRGVASALEPRRAIVAAPMVRATAPWPDDGARAYLTFDPKAPEASAAAVRAFVTPELGSSVAPEYGETAPRRAVGSVSVARVARVDDAHALVTVAAAATGGTHYLTVPVARDSRGGLVVSDLPSLVAPPARASVPIVAAESLPAGERAPVEDVVSRFLRAYLAGDTGGLAFFVPAGVRIGALGQRHELVDVTALTLTTPAQGRVREVVAAVRAKDAATGATYGLRYRLRLVREDRWLVAAVNTIQKAG